MTATSAIGGMVVQHALDLGRVHVLAAGDHHVLHAVGDEQEAVVVEVADVAGVEPALGVDGGAGGLGLVPVALHDVRAAGAHLALGARLVEHLARRRRRGAPR